MSTWSRRALAVEEDVERDEPHVRVPVARVDEVRGRVEDDRGVLARQLAWSGAYWRPARARPRIAAASSSIGHALLDERDGAGAQDLLAFLRGRLGREADDRSARSGAITARVAAAPSRPGQPVVHQTTTSGARSRADPPPPPSPVADRSDHLEVRLQAEQELERRAVDLVVLDEQDA